MSTSEPYMTVILATVRQSPDRLIVFAADDSVYVVVCNPADGRWSWYGASGEPWCCMSYASMASAVRSLRAWLALRYMQSIEYDTGRFVWTTRPGRAARWVDYA